MAANVKKSAEPGPSSGRLAHYLPVVVEERALLSRNLSGNGGPRA